MIENLPNINAVEVVALKVHCRDELCGILPGNHDDPVHHIPERAPSDDHSPQLQHNSLPSRTRTEPFGAIRNTAVRVSEGRRAAISPRYILGRVGAELAAQGGRGIIDLVAVANACHLESNKNAFNRAMHSGVLQELYWPLSRPVVGGKNQARSRFTVRKRVPTT